MPRGILVLVVTLLVAGVLLYVLSTQAEPVPQSSIEVPVANAPAQ